MNETYKRQIPLIGTLGQEKLTNANVLVVGAGGIGNIAAKYLASSGVGRIVITDNDVVEKSNLNRQLLFNTDSLNHNKAIKLAEVITKINPEIDCLSSPNRVQDLGLLSVHSFDLILDCTDDLDTSYYLEKAALSLKIPLIFAKTSKYFGVVTVIRYEPYLEKNYPTKQLNKDNSVFPVIGGIVGSYQANLALKLILGLNVTDMVIHFDCLNDNIIKYEKTYSI